MSFSSNRKDQTMNKYAHMRENWGLAGNPFPSEAIHTGSEPYNPNVFPVEQDSFFSRLVYGAAMDRRGFGFLWSKGTKDDTGFGKTALLQHAATLINSDFGATVLSNAGMSGNELPQQRTIA